MSLIYHQVAVNVPLYTLLNYAYAHRLPEGSRVVVPFRGRSLVGIVWHSDVAPSVALKKILSIQKVFDQECLFSLSWRLLIEFTARYYHYPIGQVAMMALPLGLSRPKSWQMPEKECYFSLSEVAKGLAEPPLSHCKKRALWLALASGSLNMAGCKLHHPQAQKLLALWQENGWIVERSPHHSSSNAHHQSIVLNEYQAVAYQTVCDNLHHFVPFLLLGITGSGKTEVYFEVMAQVFAQGKQVLFLLPEINLTPQLLARFQKHFPHIPSVLLHSKTATGERTRHYLRAMSNQAALVIGTRLSIFTPMPHLGLIVVDEEHDSSFKQNNDLRYNARDLAIWRAQHSQCPVILGSATPSLESYHATQIGRYHLLQLPCRAKKNARLPEIILEDIRRQKLDNGFSERAKTLLQNNFQQGGLSLVYLNRRGFAPVIFCGDCGHGFSCAHCSSKMVLHQKAQQLRCHHCDARMAIPHACPECGNQDLLALGHGTQRVEDTLANMLPEARIFRVDRDSTGNKNDWQEVYKKINNNQIDILVGTQMLAKGHDFERLNLVVVLNADGSLYSANIRAPEQLFSQLMQVAGRAGRADKPGQVLIQTQLPEHIVFQAIKAQNYPDFANAELHNRQQFNAIPWIYSAALRADAPQLAQAEAFLRQCMQQIRLPENVSALGPAPQLMVRLADRERAQISLESANRNALHQAVSAAQQIMEQQQRHNRNIRYSIDIDPQEC